MANLGLIQDLIKNVPRSKPTTALGRGAQQQTEDLAKVMQEYASGNRNVAETGLGYLSKGLAKPIEEGVSYFIPDVIEESFGKAVGAGLEFTGADKALAWAQENYPDASRALGESLSLAGLASPTSSAKAAIQKAMIRQGAPESIRSDRDRAKAGSTASNFNVIIDNFYNPDAKVGGIYKTFKGDSKLAQGGRKILGVLEWGAKGSWRTLKNMVNPVARARYIETGVAPVAMEGYKALTALEARNKNLSQKLDAERKSLSKNDPRYEEIKTEQRALSTEVDKAIETLTSQLQQMGNIQAQAGSVPLKTNVPLTAVEKASRPGSAVYGTKAELGDNWYDSAGQLGNVKPLPSNTNAQISSYIEDAWKNSGLEIDRAKILVKDMTSKYTGNHWAVLSQDPVTNAIERVFRPVTGRTTRAGVTLVPTTKTPSQNKISVAGSTKNQSVAPSEGFFNYENVGGELQVVPDVAALRKRLEESIVTKDIDGKLNGDEGLIKTHAGAKPKNFRILGDDPDGVWITFSTAGRAKVEGGVNVIMRVDPDGTLTAVVSDLHDFGDKIPVLNKILDNSLPNQVVAVTPPMQTNVQSISTLRSTPKKWKEEFTNKPTVPQPPPGVSKQQARDNLNVLKDLNPSRLEVARQAGTIADAGLFAGQMLLPEEQEQ
jgi:hypothetical protein